MSKISHTDIINLDFTDKRLSQIIPWKDYVISIKVWLMSPTKEQAVHRTHLR